MKLSQALIIRSDYQNKIYELKKRIINNSKVQEGENVSEDPMKLLKELNRVIDELDIITKRINKTNNESLFEDNITIADAICTRDTIKKKRNAIVAIIEEATIKVDRYSQSEVKFISTISIEQLQTKWFTSKRVQRNRYENTRKKLDYRITVVWKAGSLSKSEH